MSSYISDNACYSPLFADAEIEACFRCERLMALMLAFELELTRALVDHDVVETSAGEAALAAIEDFTPDAGMLGIGSLQDGLPVPAFVRSLKAHVASRSGEVAAAAVHVGATSQDLVDTVLVLNLRAASLCLSERLARVVEQLERLDDCFGAKNLMARTRMQAALPITVSDRLDSWVMPLRGHLSDLPSLRQRVEQIQFGGPVGTRNGLGDKGDAVASQLAAAFDLGNPQKAWHSMREAIVDYGDFLSKLTGSLGKMGMDICLMAQQGGGEIVLKGSGTSSAMPHKQNPVLAEMLVAFARFNGVQVSGLHHAMVHEQERSGMAWTLEWMILPLMVATAGKALLHADTLLAQVESIGDA
ncbi:3-carboxy-cis,cis-muconate cycloisomerase [uncultured Cohaesibacter sp.]|uniref:3-carboxy-cis,cis-muconate cycloisomerase n=1 Tax=uncultured Cohaesibacter sp. TaxID=1002546 RepID=UPI00292F90F0|nr:3-carboxy-cis,cis-muconate cycloisomerase [uncultured Cohaesibacter sp.]